MKKKILKRLGYVLFAVIAIAAALAGYVQVDGIPKYKAEIPTDIHVEPTKERVAQGKKLGELLCVSCHLNKETQRLTGSHIEDMPAEFGVVYSKNITQHPERGIGKWTDAELVYFLRTGIRPDGQYVPPWMIKLPHLSDEDMFSIIAWLRSDDPRLAPTDVPPAGVTQPTFLAKALTHGVFGPLPYPKEPIATPPKTDKIAYGRYLVFALDCYGCHSADFKSMNILEPEKTPGYMGGGNAIVGTDGHRIFTANLTPDMETGIGTWSEKDFVRALRKGFRPDGRALHYPMLPKPELDDEDASAIYNYLRSIPPIKNKVQRPQPTVADRSGHPGKKLYAQYGCGGCHGAEGKGAVGDLRAANEHFPTDEALRAWIEDAPSLKPGTKMPAWKGTIKDEDYEPLMGYVRLLARPAKQAQN